MASLESFGVDEYGNVNGVNLPDFTGCLLLATTPTPPAGTLVADGSEVSREAYAKLFAIFGTQYGEGDGVTTFTLPDWRDEFPRFSGAARAVLTTQTDAIRNITATAMMRASGDVGADVLGLAVATANGVFYRDGITGAYYPTNVTGLGADNPESKALLRMDASLQVPTADENRPRNVAFLPCVIYV